MTISTSPTAPLVGIVGITGNQGGSVAPVPYPCLTRNAQKSSAKVLTGLGLELVTISVTVGNEDGVRTAFAGANIVFAVTNFNEHFDKEREITEGKLMVDASLAVGVSLFVWSALEPFTALFKGRLSLVAFFDSKAAISEYALASGVPLAIVQPGYYATNILESAPLPLSHRPTGATTRVPLIDVESDYGLYVRAAIESPALGAGSENSRAEFEEVFLFKAMAPILADMYQAYEEVGYYGPKALSSKDILARKLKSWREFLEATPKENFPESIRPA
ncbi:NAD(P)-binding protein [Mycena leptocephala]|nr:NAD(P)-binding protein [Mycena leptocephala]